MIVCAASNNAGKLKELRRILEQMGHEVKSLRDLCIDLDPEETGTTFAENARIKAEAFCKALSKKSGRPYRLPGEAEWEYACRAGSGTAFHFGETITTDLANYVGEFTYQNEPKGIYRHVSTEVGQFPPNAFGLYDMHGNIWEWCADDWHDNYTGAPVDGSAWKSRYETVFRVLRGGSWHEPPINCRSATRLKMDAREADDLFGFRVALGG